MRHLLFHIWPLDTLAGRNCLKWHLRQLQKRAEAFDGQWIFAVVTGPGLVPVEEVVKLLPPHAQVIVRPNDANFGESCTLPMLLAKAFTLAEADTIFYAHTKGITHLGTVSEAPTRYWALGQYRWLLSEEALLLSQKHPFVGWLKYEGQHSMFPPCSTWHFGGNFWWFRPAEIYRLAWWIVFPTRFGAEAYPSTLVSTEKAACRHSFSGHTLVRPDGQGHMYFLDFWKRFGIPMGPDATSYEEECG